MLCVEDLHVTFPGTGEGGDVRAVRGLSYRLRRGEILGIVGESGAGKSASALAVMGLLPDRARVSGSVRLNGRELLGLDERRLAAIRGRAVSMVFQDPMAALTPVHTVGDQLAEAVRVHHPGTGRARARERAVELLRLVGIPDADRRVDAFPHEFSGGMRQRVMIAMAMANNPDVILCDEPTTALDATVQAQILDLLATVRRETGTAIVVITHDLGVVAALADRVLVMYAGRPVETGTVAEVYHRPRMPYTMGLLGTVPRVDTTGRGPLPPIGGTPPTPTDPPPGCPFAPRCPVALPQCDTESPRPLPVGSAPDSTHRVACLRADEITANHWSAADLYPRPDAPPAAARTPRARRPTVLRVDNLVKHHPLYRGTILRRRVGAVRAVDGVSFDLREHETLALVGESGAGKSTTLTAILDLTRPDHGGITVLGRDTGTLSPKERFALRRDLQVVFQDAASALDPRMPVAELVAEPLRVHRHPRQRIPHRVRELLALVGLDDSHAQRHPAQLSGGQRQRVGIARAIALEPRLLLLDEPVSALDVSIRAGVLALLTDLQTRLGMSYLFVAHDLAVVRHVADRVAVMHLGVVVEIGDTASVYTDPRHPYTRALLSALPVPDPVRERGRTRIVLDGDPPDPSDPPSGCRFRTRCPKFRTLPEPDRRRCVTQPPELRPVHDADHAVACHHA
nr:ABC transporter ATP-binding protein [Thermobifida halotolerans]